MKIEDEVRYDSAPDVVAAMLADPQFVSDVSTAMGALDHSQTIEGDSGGAFVVTARRTMPTDSFPEAARSFVGATVELVQVDRWEAPGADHSRSGTMELSIAGAPISMSSDLTLRPDGVGSVQTMDGELKASIPLLGGKLEKAAAPAVRAGVRALEATGRTYLSS